MAIIDVIDAGPDAYSFVTDDGREPFLAYGQEANEMAERWRALRGAFPDQRTAQAPTGAAGSVPDTGQVTPGVTPAQAAVRERLTAIPEVDQSTLPPQFQTSPLAPSGPRPAPTVAPEDRIRFGAGASPRAPVSGGVGGSPAGAGTDTPAPPMVRVGGSPGRNPMRERELGVPVPQSVTTVQESGGIYDPADVEARGEAGLNRRMTEQGIAERQAEQAQIQSDVHTLVAGRLNDEARTERDNARRAEERAGQMWGEVQSTAAAYKEGKIEPNAIFGDSAGAALAAFGMVLFSFIPGSPIPKIIERMIERSIDAQEQELRVKGDAAQNALKQYQLALGDMDLAKDALRATMKDVGHHEIGAAAKAAGSEEALMNFERWDAQRQEERVREETAFRDKAIGQVKTTIQEAVVQPEAASRAGQRAMTPDEESKWWDVQLKRQKYEGETAGGMGGPGAPKEPQEQRIMKDVALREEGLLQMENAKRRLRALRGHPNVVQFVGRKLPVVGGLMAAAQDAAQPEIREYYQALTAYWNGKLKAQSGAAINEAEAQRIAAETVSALPSGEAVENELDAADEFAESIKANIRSILTPEQAEWMRRRRDQERGILRQERLEGESLDLQDVE